MKPNTPILLAALALALAAPISGSAKDNKQQKSNHATASCPPGLAKKNPPCVPPGQARKYHDGEDLRRYRVGERIDRDDDYIVIPNPGRYGLIPTETYYRVGDSVFRVNRDTREILDFIGAAAALLN
ncbi:hypothetical protein [Sedimentitalea nanhaiensis]|uniref:Excinuclease ABC subunit A n=1 Tax=Sedimentitalea nanhaiensis TaxID=999627 RepID=A0A1I7BC54_9RHOB|nr:hypothetical protein [Sedimentitalea nanhaiensis]SFT84721.1 hypothetical protein SAMN05216236_10980 [Sedimentitalea nanhaiensis]